jgi:hypothetical protein
MSTNFRGELTRRIAANNRLLKQLCQNNGGFINTVVENLSGGGSSEIPAGALSYSITNINGTSDWTFNGVTIPSSVSTISDDTGQLSDPITVDSPTDDLLIIYTTKA